MTDGRSKVHGDDVPESSLQFFDKLPDAAFVRVGVVAALRNCSVATVWRHAQLGQFPKPKKLSERITAWNVGEIRAALAK